MRELVDELRRLAGAQVTVEVREDGMPTVNGPRWCVELPLESGRLGLVLRRRDWESRRDVLASIDVPAHAPGTWARHVAVTVFQTLTQLEGDDLETGPRLKLVLVDDEELMLRVLARTLGRRHDVQAFSDPIAGLRAAIAGDPDGILVDFRMPQLHGLDWIAQLNEARPDLGPRCCLMTAEPERVTFATHDLMLAKPLSIEDLNEVLRLFAVLRAETSGNPG